MMPRFDSVWPMRAVSLSRRRWQAMAISQPPPMAWPLMAAMIGLGKRSILRITLLPKRMNASTSPPENAEPRSAPPQKIRSPAPVMITARTLPSPCRAFSASLSSRISASLMAFAGGRFSVMTANPSSRSSSRVSNAIARDSFEEDRGHLLRGVDQVVAALAQHPRGRHLVHGAEQHLGRHLHGQVGPEASARHSLLQHRGDQVEVGRDLVRRGTAEELVALAKLHLHHLGELRILFQHPEVHAHQPADLDHRIRLAGDLPALLGNEAGHLLAKERDQDLFLGLEIEVDRSTRAPGLARDVGHSGVVVAGPREDADGGVDDLLRLLGITHVRAGLSGRRVLSESRFILRVATKRCQRVIASWPCGSSIASA